MEEECSHLVYGVFQVSFFVLISTIITALVMMVYMKQIWSANWEEHRCKLHVMPFASIVKPGVSVTDNFNECVRRKSEPMFRAYAQKKLNERVAETILENKKTQKAAKKSADEIDKAGEEMKSRFSVLTDAYDHMVSVLVYISHKVQNFFYKIGAIVWTLYYLLIAQINAVMIQIAQFQRTLGILNALLILTTALTYFIPILLPLTVLMTALIIQANLTHEAAKKRAYCCFTPDTKIEMKNEQKQKISGISVNDEVKGGGRVSGVITLRGKNIPVVRIGNETSTTEDHLCLNIFNTWCSVEELYKKGEETTDEVRCLVTENNLIVSNGNVFRDYEEVSDSNVQCAISGAILDDLGYDGIFEPNRKYELGEKNNCIPGKTKVKMWDSSFKQIEEIQIGENTSRGTVIGNYVCDGSNIDWVDVGENTISPRIICKKKDGKYAKGYEIGSNIHDYHSKGYHLITTNHEYELENEVVIRDFIETDNESTQERISQLVCDFLNRRNDT